MLAKIGHLLPAQYSDFGALKGMGKQKLSFFYVRNGKISSASLYTVPICCLDHLILILVHYEDHLITVTNTFLYVIGFHC